VRKVTASHLPEEKNGLKFFSKDGKKLPNEVEDEIEKNLETKVPHPTGSEVGRVKDMADAYEAYLAHLLETVKIGSLKGLKIAVDLSRSDPDQRDYFVSNRKIEKKGFRAKVSLDAGIIELINILPYLKKIKNNY
jgi:hypothetical protein